MNLNLRAIARAPDAALREELVACLLHELRAFAPRLLSQPEPYPKLEGGYEFHMQLFPPTPASFRALLELVPLGWELGSDPDEPDAVWNLAPGACLFSPHFAWAHLHLWKSNRPGDRQGLQAGD